MKLLPYILRTPIPQIKSNGLVRQAHGRAKKGKTAMERVINLKMQRGK